METVFILLLLLVVVIVAIIVTGFKFKHTPSPVTVDGEGESNIVDFDVSGAEEFEEDDDYFGSAEKKAKKSDKKTEEKKEKEVTEKEEKHETHGEKKTGFPGHFLSERVVEKHDDAGKVTLYRISVRGSMKDTHRVLVKMEEVTEENVKAEDARMRKLKLISDGKGSYNEKDYPEQNRGKFTAEEKEIAIKLLHGALNSSMLDMPTREKIVKLVSEKL